MTTMTMSTLMMMTTVPGPLMMMTTMTMRDTHYRMKETVK